MSLFNIHEIQTFDHLKESFQKWQNDLPIYFMKMFIQSQENLYHEKKYLNFRFDVNTLPDEFEEENEMIKFSKNDYYPIGGVLKRFNNETSYDGYAIIFENGECYIMMDCEKALRFAEATLVAPLIFIELVWSVILGYLIWGNVPDARVLWGALIIVCSGIIVIRRKPVV